MEIGSDLDSGLLRDLLQDKVGVRNLERLSGLSQHGRDQVLICQSNGWNTWNEYTTSHDYWSPNNWSHRVPSNYGRGELGRPPRSRPKIEIGIFFSSRSWFCIEIGEPKPPRSRDEKGQKIREKSRYIPILPDFGLKNREKLRISRLSSNRLEILKVGEASPIPTPTRPDPIFVGILSPSRYLAHS